MAKTGSKAGEGKTFVKYTALPGIVGRRIITAEDFAAHGIEHETLEWNRGNNFVLDATDLPDEVIALLKEDGGFSFSGSGAAPRLADGGTLADSAGSGGGGSGLTGGDSTSTGLGTVSGATTPGGDTV